jgi:arylsulfatase A-like enzyme
VADTLRATDEMRNTYIFFTSDNGFYHGEHRIPKEKWRPYEEDVHVPLLVRGPGVAAGSTTRKIALNTDYLPTFTDLAGTRTPSYADGRTLGPVLDGTVTRWRSAVLLEAAAHYSPTYEGIRTIGIGSAPGRKYVEYSGGARELYNLDVDPNERTNHYSSSSPVAASLAARLRALDDCAGDACFKAENGP